VLAGAGANVVIAAGNAAELKKVVESCKKLGGKVEALAKRPSSEANCEAIVKAAVERFGRLDILVVASGINKVGKIVDQAAADFLEVIDANVTQSWLMARAAGRQMIKQSGGGKVILMSSARGLLGHPAGYSAYCASKSAVDGITKALGCEWGETGITVNAIVGNFGGGRFFDYTAHGDTINVAARLEAANKQLGTRICVSETLANEVEDFHGRPVGDLMLRGKTEPLRAFEPLSLEQYGDPATKSYLDAFAKLEAGDPGAIAGFAAHVGKQPRDQLASFHLKRVLNGATGTRVAME
jgi:NAD(P)-dependent dehydrogenase (short-subunit alcohol dehydrogenase family)